MEVINPIIMAGGGQAPSANTFREMGYMANDYSQNIPLTTYSTVVKVPGPLLYIMQPGNYPLYNTQMDSSLLPEHGIARGSFRRLYIAANIHLHENNAYLNLCGVYDRNYDVNYMRGFYYVGQILAERSLPMSAGEQNCAVIPLTTLYAAFCEVGLIPLNDLKRNWREYSTLNMLYMVLEE